MWCLSFSANSTLFYQLRRLTLSWWCTPLSCPTCPPASAGRYRWTSIRGQPMGRDNASTANWWASQSGTIATTTTWTARSVSSILKLTSCSTTGKGGHGHCISILKLTSCSTTGKGGHSWSLLKLTSCSTTGKGGHALLINPKADFLQHYRQGWAFLITPKADFLQHYRQGWACIIDQS